LFIRISWDGVYKQHEATEGREAASLALVTMGGWHYVPVRLHSLACLFFLPLILNLLVPLIIRVAREKEDLPVPPSVIVTP
jgi:hypothetical protein